MRAISSKAINTILNLKDNFSNTLKKVSNNTQVFTKKIKQAENQAKSMREGITGAFTGTAAKIAAIAGGFTLGSFAKDSLMLASDLGEVENVVDTTFGNMNKDIYDFAKTAASQFGISKLQADQFAGTLGALMKSGGVAGDELKNMSLSLTGLAGDMASFFNLEPAEAFEKIKSGISGETEPLKALGINMSVANLEAYALSKGIDKQYKSMSQAEQMTLRYNYLMKATKDVQGDYAKTSDSFANSLRTMKLNFQTIGSTIMSAFIPSFQEAFKVINGFIGKIDANAIADNITQKIKYLSENTDTIKNKFLEFIPAITGVAGAFAAFQIITTITSMYKSLKNAIVAVNTAQKITNLLMSANPIGLLAVGIGAVVAAATIAYQKSATFREFINGIFDKIKNLGLYLSANFMPVVQNIANWVMTTILPQIQQLGSSILNFINTVIKPFVNFLAQQFEPIIAAVFPHALQFASDFFTGVGSFISAAINLFSNLLDFVSNVFSGNWSAAWQNVVNIFGNIFSGLGGLLKAPLNAVISLLNSAINSINGALNVDVPDWVPGIGGSHYSANIPSIPMLYKGTNFFNSNTGAAIVGERGPELLTNIPRGSKVKTARETSNIMKNSGAGIIVNVNVEGNIIGNEEYADSIGEHIARKIVEAYPNLA